MSVNGDLGRAPGGYLLGVESSPIDTRDYRLSTYCAVLAPEVQPERHSWPTLTTDDQDGVAGCVACADGGFVDVNETRETRRPFKSSRQFIYANRLLTDHKGPGMVPRNSLKQLQKCGVPSEDMWPGLVEYGKEVWPADKQTLFEAALPHRIKTYVRIEQAFITEIKSAILTLGPILYCIPVYSNFKPDSEGRIPLPSGRLEGHHGMMAPGYEPGFLDVQNSWGVGWGLGGRCRIPWEYPASEIWGVTDATTERSLEVFIIEGVPEIWINGKPTKPQDAEAYVAPYIHGNRLCGSWRHMVEALGGVTTGWGKYDSGEFANRMWATFKLVQKPW
jgi:hypothetical protein